jgi:alginate O-acetyltransferase complex protein AlgI
VDFTTVEFLGYLVITAAAYRWAPRRVSALIILGSSYLFYYLNSHSLLLLLAGNSAVVFCAALVISRYRDPRLRFTVTCTAVVTLIGALILFKGAYLLPGSWAHRLLMPLGVSYYTFKLVGYLIDVYWRATEPERNFINFAAYASFFPQIVAGPIQRSEQFLPQIRHPQAATRRTVLLGCQRILLGFFKKFVVADNLAPLVDFIYQHLHTTRMPLLLAYYGYPLQMYADFSALTDISIGAALLFGITAPENFEAPFSAASPSEYWRRWHITLTLWLTDYVFTPLRMATRRLGKVGLVLSLTTNMVLIGLWHGFRWCFVVFGLVHALYLSVDALTAGNRRQYYKQHPWASELTSRIGPVTTFHLVAVGFICFRAQTVNDILFIGRHLVGNLTAWSPEFADFMAANSRGILVGLCGYGVAEIFDWFRRRDANRAIVEALPRWGRWSVCSCTVIAMCILVMLLMVHGVKRNPFLYANF